MNTLVGVVHGTYDGYRNHDCRCDDCTQANAAYMRRRYARPCNGGCGREVWKYTKATNERGGLCYSCWLRETGQLVHGTEGGYRRGCRCDDCRRAANEARARRRRKPNVAKHGHAGYSNGCRCEQCLAAQSDYNWRRHVPGQRSGSRARAPEAVSSHKEKESSVG